MRPLRPVPGTSRQFRSSSAAMRSARGEMRGRVATAVCCPSNGRRTDACARVTKLGEPGSCRGGPAGGISGWGGGGGEISGPGVLGPGDFGGVISGSGTAGGGVFDGAVPGLGTSGPGFSGREGLGCGTSGVAGFPGAGPGDGGAPAAV